MKLNKLSLATAVAAALISTTAAAVDFHGYARAGVGASANNGENVEFDKKKVGRLGNETDNYVEIGIGKEVYNNDGVSFYLDSLVAYGQNGNNNWEGTEPALRNINVAAKGLFKSDQDAVLWAGQRYYQRKDIHITDFYFLDTSGGSGAGIENLSVGSNKFSFAVMHNDGSQVTGTEEYQEWVPAVGGGTTDGEWVTKERDIEEDINGYTIDARLAGIDLWDNANLELALAYNYANEKDGQSVVADNPVLLTAVIGQGLSNGFNQTVFQYGTAAFGAQMPGLGGGGWATGGDASNNDAKGFRLINWGVVGLGDNIELGHQVVLASGSDIGASKVDHDFMNVVVRPMYKWNDNMRTILEAGYFTEEKDSDKSSGSKLTVAQAWSAGSSFWARPEIRVYGSYVADHENDNPFGNDNDTELSVGVQMEAWW